MTCLINDTISFYLKREKKIEVIRRYIRIKYKINIDSESLLQRVASYKEGSLQMS